MFIKEKIIKYKDFENAKKLDISEAEYVITYEYSGKNKVIHLCQDDYGQCYFLCFIKDGKKEEISCGTYNFEYEDCIEYVFENILNV